MSCDMEILSDISDHVMIGNVIRHFRQALKSIQQYKVYLAAKSSTNERHINGSFFTVTFIIVTIFRFFLYFDSFVWCYCGISWFQNFYLRNNNGSQNTTWFVLILCSNWPKTTIRENFDSLYRVRMAEDVIKSGFVRSENQTQNWQYHIKLWRRKHSRPCC